MRKENEIENKQRLRRTVRRTLVKPHYEADCYALQIKEELSSEYEWCRVSDSMPVVVDGVLCCMITFVAGDYI